MAPDVHYFLLGMNGLTNTTVDSFDIPSDSPGQLNVVFNASIFNPSIVAMYLGDIYFDVVLNNVIVGEIKMPNMTLEIGMPNLSGSILFVVTLFRVELSQCIWLSVFSF